MLFFWPLRILIGMLVVGWASACGNEKDPPKENKNPIPHSVEVSNLKKNTQWMVFSVCITCLLTLLGCAKEKAHVLDGPDMEYQLEWTSFTLSRMDSNNQYSFWFTVTDKGDHALVKGECRDENHNSYCEEIGVEISGEDRWQLRWLNLDKLPAEEPWPDELELPTDMPRITLTLTLPDGTIEMKNASGDLSMQIYNLLLPYLEKNRQ